MDAKRKERGSSVQTQMSKILILGGYGNFGKRIAAQLAAKGVAVVIAGRSASKAAACAKQLSGTGATHASVTFAAFDAHRALDENLRRIRPRVVINTIGPFQTSDYKIVRACMDNKVHYIDLADGRRFVTGIAALDARARQQGVTVISGASTVPGLSSAVLDHYGGTFSRMTALIYGISPGQQAERGLATTQGIMTYVGKPLAPFPGGKDTLYGWQDIHRQAYPGLGKRWMANCDIPDLDLLPERYGLRRIRFSAGLELAPLHLGLWGLSWLVRLGVPLNLPGRSKTLLRMSNRCNSFGSADGGMHMIIHGLDHDGSPISVKWFIIARNGDGPYIPTIASVLVGKHLAEGKPMAPGARACVGLISLADILRALESRDIATFAYIGKMQGKAMHWQEVQERQERNS